jgi:hypothetical protein
MPFTPQKTTTARRRPAGPLHLDVEVHMPGVSMMLMRVPCHWMFVQAEGDGDAPLLLLLEVVHGRGAVVDLASLWILCG